ncbi:MAG: tetratricopeptide repeat protein [Polyangiaceae bacterium]
MTLRSGFLLFIAISFTIGCQASDNSARAKFAETSACPANKVVVTEEKGAPLPPAPPPPDVAADPGKLAVWKQEDQDRRESAAATVYVAKGCGQEKSYNCNRDEHHAAQTICTEIDARALSTAPTSAPSDADLEKCAAAPPRPQDPAEERSKGAKHCALGSEGSCTSACNDHDAESCAILGKMYGEGISVELSYDKSTDFLTLACGAGSARGCHGLGVVHDFGHGMAPDAAGAVPFYDRACSWGYGESCANLAAHYMSGSGVAKDPKKAFAFAQKGCAWGSAAGCKRLGALYLAGIGVDKDTSCASITFRKGCADGDAAACDLARRL